MARPQRSPADEALVSLGESGSLVRARRQEHATHEPLISSVIVEEVPLAGLSFDNDRVMVGAY